MSRLRLCDSGHVTTLHDLVAQGANPKQLARAVKSGQLVKVRRGVYACPHANPVVVDAARRGGTVTCVTVLRAHRVWAGNSRIPHLQVPPNSSGRSTRGVHLHWEVPHFEMTSPWIAGRQQSLWQAIRCLDEENAIAAIESAIKTRFLTRAAIDAVVALAPGRMADGLSRIVNDSGSGLETIARLRLERAGFEAIAQPAVPGLGHQDLLINGCVGIELDGEEWHGHDQFEADRERDLHAAILGRRTIRLTSRQVFHHWPDVLSAVERAVRDSHGVRN